jgi:hypothetical protein
MSRQLPVHWHGGHMLVDPIPGSGLRALIDTGAGHTASHRKGDGYLGTELSDIEDLAGTRIDLLIGLDAFRVPVMLTRDYVEFNAARPQGVQMPTSGPVPEFQVQLCYADTPLRNYIGWAYFDSGAEKSYIAPGFGGRYLRMTNDFFPPVGKYQAMQFTNLVEIAGRKIPIEPVVPLHRGVNVTTWRRPLLLGSELLLWGDLWIDLPHQQVIFRRT